MHVYVKRVVPGSPADRCVTNPPGHRIQPGDSLLLINGEDVYGLGLDVLRDRIPGPAGSIVVLGFKSLAGDLFEAELQRSEYGPGPQEPRGRYQPNQSDDGVIRAPRNRSAALRNPPSRAQDGGHSYMSNGFAPGRTASAGAQARLVPARTVQVPIMQPGSMTIPMNMDAMQAPTVVQQGGFRGGEPQFITVGAVGPGQAMQYQYGVGFGMGIDFAGPSFAPQQFAQQQFAPQQFTGQQQFAPQPQQFQLMPQFAPGPGMAQMGPGMPMMAMQAPPMGQMQFPHLPPQYFQ